MMDAILIAAGIVFFAMAIGYSVVCDRL